MGERTYLDVEDLDVYRRLCQLHIDVCDLTHAWPKECIRMLNGLEKTLEGKLPVSERR